MRHAQCLIRNIGRGRHFWILNVLICQQTSKTWSPEDVFPTSSVQATLEKGQGTQIVTELYKLWRLPGPISNDLHMGWDSAPNSVPSDSGWGGFTTSPPPSHVMGGGSHHHLPPPSHVMVGGVTSPPPPLPRMLVVTPPTLEGVRGGGEVVTYPRRFVGGGEVVTRPALEDARGGEVVTYPRRCVGGVVVLTPPTLEDVREGGGWWPPLPQKVSGEGGVVVTPPTLKSRGLLLLALSTGLVWK